MPVHSPPPEAAWDIPRISAQECARFAGLIQDLTGIHLRANKGPLLVARLSKRLKDLKLRSFSDYYRFLENDTSGKELLTLINKITTNKTSFFREPHHFEFIRSRLIPEIQKAGRRDVRIWSAGCSSGEEPYSIAIALLEALGGHSPWDIRILATDIDSEVLAQAGAGRYPLESIEEMETELKRKYFLRGYGKLEGIVEVRPKLMRMINFRRLNFMQADWHVKDRFDIVFCRNVIIYFQQPVQEQIVRGLTGHLRPGGYYFSGHSENLHYLRDALDVIEPSIYQLRSGGSGR